MAETLLLALVVVLMIFAALDLFVGVSNDACNFLNSAVGARIAPYGIVVLVASAGVIAGATSSSGMMEIARNGMFFPERFNLLEVMAIFSAVMIADVLL
ncbi:MAG: inorganic phosphate transporter, partial [Succinivibrio sp.]